MRGLKRLLLLAAIGAGFATSCGPEPRVSSPSTPTPPASSFVDAATPIVLDAASDAASRPTGAAPRLEPVGERAPPKPTPHVEILFPFAEQRVVIPKAKSYPVRVKVESWPLGEEGAGVELKLDDGRPRRLLPGAAFKLGDLLRDGAEIKPGAHWLTAAAVDGDGSLVRPGASSLAPFASVRFWVGDRDPAASAPAPRVLLFSPRGTYNGPRAADSMLIDFLATPERIGVEGGSALVRLSGRGFSPVEQRLIKWQPIQVRDAPNGDLDVEVTLFDKNGAAIAGARAAETVTVNRDAPMPAQKP